MAYMNQTRKATIASNVKPILAKYGMKGTFSVRNHSTITLTLQSGPIDFLGDLNPERANISGVQVLRKQYHLDINPYWYDEHYIQGSKAHNFLSELIPAMKSADWYDRSDMMTDYFDTAYYFDINVGRWNKPYVLTR